MRADSMDLRLRVLAAADDGDTTAEVADRFAARPSRTLAAPRDALGLRRALATPWAAVRRLGLTFKKG